jgi:phosphoribosylanthranilate isomerase
VNVKVKICGLMRPEDTEAAIDAGTDFVGVVFADGRRRQTIDSARRIMYPARPVTGRSPLNCMVSAPDSKWFAAQATALAAMVEDFRPRVVGVFQRQPLDEIAYVADQLALDFIQLSAEDPWTLPEPMALSTIKTVRISEIGRIKLQPGPVLCLLDSDRPGSGLPGDWDKAAEVAQEIPAMLAGGLTPGNVVQAIETVRPWGVDVSSGVETNGRKDPVKIRDFIQAAKSVQL